MLNIGMLPLLALILLALSPCGAPAEVSANTYTRRDPFTGKTLVCDMCPPGEHMAAHCTASTPTRCAPCREDHFTELWNYLPRCLYCNNICHENQEVEKECSPSSNRVCRCKQGYYSSDDDFCMRHSECAPGHGVQTNGTSITNTVCEECAEGYYSGLFSALDTCARHQECALGETAILNGSVYHDTVCGTCEDFSSGGETYRRVLSGFFSMQKMRFQKLKKFVSRFVHKKSMGVTSLPRTRGLLLNQIKGWLAEAPQDELKKLPGMLRSSPYHTTSDKLKKLLSEIERQNQDCRLV